MKVLFLYILFVFTPFLILSQKMAVRGSILDRNDPEVAIPEVNVYTSSNPKSIVKSLSNGLYEITIDVSKGIDTIFFKHVGYELAYKTFTAKSVVKAQKKELSFITYNAQLNFFTLKEFNFNSKIVDTVFGSEKYAVEDFLILESNRLLLLVYEKTMNKGSQILLTDEKQKEITTMLIPDRAIYLFKDYADNNYVICEKNIYKINIVNTQLRLLNIHPEDFYGFHQRVIDTIKENYYYSDFNKLYPAVKFLITHSQDTTNIELHEVKDQFMMELYRAQYKYVSGRDKLWAYRKEQETGIDKEIWIGASSFTQDILYKPVYAPLFIKADTVHIFDQYEGLLYRYDKHHALIDSVKISYFRTKGSEKWEQPLIKDSKTDVIYGIYNIAGYNYLKVINCQNGEISKGFKLANRFVEQIKIYDGYVYYVYRPFESLQKKFLYREPLIFQD